MNGFGSEGLCQLRVMDSLGAKVAVEVPGFGLVVAAVVPARRGTGGLDQLPKPRHRF